MAIGVLLGVIAVILAREMQSLLIGEAAGDTDRAAIEAAIHGVDAVVSLAHLRTQHLGPDDILVGAKVVLRPDFDTAGVTLEFYQAFPGLIIPDPQYAVP